MGKLVLKVLCLENRIAISLDQSLSEKNIPITEYFFWPQSDAWDDLCRFMESKKWIDSIERIYILNILTDLIDYWGENSSLEQKDLPVLLEKFPSVVFVFIN